MNNNHERHLTWSFVRFRIHVILTTNVLINRTVTWYTVEARSYSLMAVPPLSVPSRWFPCDGPLLVIPLLRFLCGGFFEAASPCCDTLAVAPLWRCFVAVSSRGLSQCLGRRASLLLSYGALFEIQITPPRFLRFLPGHCVSLCCHFPLLMLLILRHSISSKNWRVSFLFLFTFLLFITIFERVLGCSSLSRWVLSNFIVISEDYPGLLDIFMGIYFSEIFLKIERLL